MAVKSFSQADARGKSTGVTPSMRSDARNTISIVLPLIALFALPYVLTDSRLIVSTCVAIAILAVMAYGCDLVLSYLGEVSFGHVVFLAAGGYVTAYGSIRMGLGPMQTAGLTIVIALAMAFVLGLATLRVRAFMFSLVTYASAIVIHEIVYNTDALGGSEGLPGIPPMKLAMFGFSYVVESNLAMWPFAFGLLALTIYFVARFRRSHIGRAALMVHMNPALATSLGIDVRRVRLAVFVISAPVTALAGWLYAYQRAYIGPDLFEGYFLILMLCAVILFGQRLLLGPLLGVSVILLQQNFLSAGGDGDKIILGTILVAVLLLMPNGLAQAWMKRRRQQ